MDRHVALTKEYPVAKNATHFLYARFSILAASQLTEGQEINA